MAGRKTHANNPEAGDARPSPRQLTRKEYERELRRLQVDLDHRMAVGTAKLLPADVALAKWTGRCADQHIFSCCWAAPALLPKINVAPIL